jgi:hypothetical protein
VALAYHLARTHGLHEEANEIWAATGQPAEEMPAAREGRLLLPPVPIAKVRSAAAERDRHADFGGFRFACTYYRARAHTNGRD